MANPNPVLPVTRASVTGTVAPVGGFKLALPYSVGLFALKGMLVASACAPSIFAVSASPGASRSFRAGPLTVDRALVVVAAAPAPFCADFFSERTLSKVFFVAIHAPVKSDSWAQRRARR